MAEVGWSGNILHTKGFLPFYTCFFSFFQQVWLMVLTLHCLNPPAKYFPLKRMCHKQNILVFHQQRQVNCKQFTALHVIIFSSPERSKMTAALSSAEPGWAVRERISCEAWTLPQPWKMEMQGQVKEGVKAGCELGQHMSCPARDPSPAWISPHWGQAPPYMCKEGREVESRGRGCEDQCPKCHCKSQSLKKAAQLEKKKQQFFIY